MISIAKVYTLTVCKVDQRFNNNDKNDRGYNNIS